MTAYNRWRCDGPKTRAFRKRRKTRAVDTIKQPEQLPDRETISRRSWSSFLRNAAPFAAFCLVIRAKPLMRPRNFWAAERGVVYGYDNGDGTRTLRPLEPVARERAVTAFNNGL